MSKVIITGASGFIGRNLARHFSRKGWQVYGIDSNAEESAPMADLKGYYAIRLPSDKLGPIFQSIQPDLCVHCAGRSSVGLSVSDPRSDFFSGPVLTWEMLDAIRLHASRCRFVFISSAAVYGSPEHLPISEAMSPHPLSPYGCHKWQSELICQEFSGIYGLQVAVARVFSAYGPGLRRQVVWDLFHQAMTHSRISAQGTGMESRDFIHVSDLCLALETIAKNAPFCGEPYNVASGQETEIAQLATMISASAAPGCEIHFNGKLPPGTPTNWRADIAALQKLGFSPAIKIQDGIRSFGAWCRAELLGF
jgi:UDP-glucose 4-epimerase